MLVTIRELHDNIRKSMVYQFDGNFEKLRYSIYELIPKVLASYEIIKGFEVTEEIVEKTLEDTKWLLKELILFLKKDLIRDIDVKNINESIAYYMNQFHSRAKEVYDLKKQLGDGLIATGGGIVLSFSTFYVLIAFGNINEEVITEYFTHIDYMIKDVIEKDWTAIVDLKKVDYNAFPVIEQSFLKTTKFNVGDNKAFVVIEKRSLSGFAAKRISKNTVISSNYKETFEWLYMNSEMDIKNIKFIGNIADILGIITN